MANDAPGAQLTGLCREQGPRGCRCAARPAGRDLRDRCISFSALKDKAEFAYLNQQPTTFVLTPEAVDRLRKAARTIIRDSPEFKRLMQDVGTRVVASPSVSGAGAARH